MSRLKTFEELKVTYDKWTSEHYMDRDDSICNDLMDALTEAREVIRFYAGINHPNEKERTHWKGDSFFAEDKFGTYVSDRGRKAKDFYGNT